MKFCGRHWEALREAIRARGLFGLVATSGEQVVAMMTKELGDGESTKATFDPLMGAHNAIVSNVMGVVGIAVMMQNEDGSDRCPLCFIQSEHDAHCKLTRCEPYDTWINRAADDMRAKAVDLGLLAAT